MKCVVQIVLIVVASVFSVTALSASFDDGSRYAFSGSNGEKRVVAFDLREQEVAGYITLDARPDQVLASDSLDALIVSHRAARRLTLVDLADVKLGKVDYALEMSPDYISLSPLGDSVAIYETKNNHLEVHNVKRRAVLLSADNVNMNSEFTFSPDGSSLYWPDNKTGSMHSIDLWSNREMLKLAEPGEELSALSRSADGLLGFVSGTSTDEVFVINLSDFSLLASIKVPPAPDRPWGTADGRFMFVAGRSSNTVSAIATDNLRLQYSVRLEDRPLSIHSGWLDTVAAITTESGNVIFIDVESGKILEQYQLNQRPLEAIVTSDSKTLAVPLSGNGEMAFFNMRDQVKEKILTGLPLDIGEASIAVSNNLCH
jgi:DNA-binding beta-propeller fold protein YncE